MQAAKALANLCICADSPELVPFVCAISTEIDGRLFGNRTSVSFLKVNDILTSRLLSMYNGTFLRD